MQFLTYYHLCHRQIKNSTSIPSDGNILSNASIIKSGNIENDIGRGSSGLYGCVIHSLSVYGDSLFKSEAQYLFLEGTPPSCLIAWNSEAYIGEYSEVEGGGGGTFPSKWYG